MFPMMKEELSFDLPEDVILKILCRLPVKSLIRFSCVSKRWHTIIFFDPQFGKAHLKVASELRTITRRLLLLKRSSLCAIDTPKQSPRLQSSENSFRGNSLVRCLTMPSEENITNVMAIQSLANSFGENSLVRNLTIPSQMNITNVMASCNGLVLLGTDHYDLSIWNPSTGFFRKLPAPDFSAIIKCEMITGKHGVGYVSSTDDYIVLVIPASFYPVDGDVNMFIFSMRANSWKLSKVSGWFSLSYGRTSQSGTLLNEAIHWANYHRYYRDGGLIEQIQIYAFDLANEESRQLPVPCFNQDDNGNGVEMQTVDRLGGCLCVLSWTWHPFRGMDQDSELWMMRDYGVSDSWMKLFKFSSNDLPEVFGSYRSWLPIVVTEDGAVVIKLIVEKELIRIECRKEEKPVCRDRYRLEELHGCDFLFDVILYAETLLSVSECLNNGDLRPENNKQA
ncbi:F-box/kelch-repeat protein At3g06240-like [Rosa rugosa]|uniref:F-box/kelch-repeat protein At3g06240-like n=1 Tax=Rosa rugosa TaxID=74645 RepID=UPI002B410667|nr:F-box/kelch-repeat protein At3g06240-like [Rosa rugosa]